MDARAGLLIAEIAELQAALDKAKAGSMEAVTAAFEEQVKAPVSNLISGKLLQSLLVLVHQVRPPTAHPEPQPTNANECHDEATPLDDACVRS